MKRKSIVCMIILTALLLSGCTNKTTQGTEQSSAVETAPHSTTDTVIPPASTDTVESTDHQENGTAQTGTAQDGTTQDGTAQDGTTQNGTAQNSTTQNSTVQNGADGATMISEEEAKQIALAHAGLKADQVTFIKSGKDREDGHIRYDVEFYTTDKKEYDYEIDPYTGEILEYDYDAEYYPQSANSTDTAAISEDEAKQIALKKVSGATTNDIREFKTDYDNSKLKYEGKIYYDHKEYEFEIDAHTGDILEWDEEQISAGNL